jgi:hypothetical protein
MLFDVGFFNECFWFDRQLFTLSNSKACPLCRLAREQIMDKPEVYGIRIGIARNSTKHPRKGAEHLDQDLVQTCLRLGGIELYPIGADAHLIGKASACLPRLVDTRQVDREFINSAYGTASWIIQFVVSRAKQATVIPPKALAGW